MPPALPNLPRGRPRPPLRCCHGCQGGTAPATPAPLGGSISRFALPGCLLRDLEVLRLLRLHGDGGRRGDAEDAVAAVEVALAVVVVVGEVAAEVAPDLLASRLSLSLSWLCFSSSPPGCLKSWGALLELDQPFGGFQDSPARRRRAVGAKPAGGEAAGSARHPPARPDPRKKEGREEGGECGQTCRSCCGIEAVPGPGVRKMARQCQNSANRPLFHYINPSKPPISVLFEVPLVLFMHYNLATVRKNAFFLDGAGWEPTKAGCQAVWPEAAGRNGANGGNRGEQNATAMAS